MHGLMKTEIRLIYIIIMARYVTLQSCCYVTVCYDLPNYNRTHVTIAIFLVLVIVVCGATPRVITEAAVVIHPIVHEREDT